MAQQNWIYHKSNHKLKSYCRYKDNCVVFFGINYDLLLLNVMEDYNLINSGNSVKDVT